MNHPYLILIITIIAVSGVVVGYFNYQQHPNLFCAFNLVEKAQAQTDCNYYPQAHYYDGILQLYPHNPYGHIWNLEQGPLPYNGGSKVVAVGGGWYQNIGPDLNRIRNEVATPHFSQTRPTLGIGGNGPYNQDSWRYYGFMDRPDDWKNIEISGLYYACKDCQQAGQGPQAVDFVLRGGVQDSTPPYNCQAPSYHIAYGFTGDDGGWKLERDIDHTQGYCSGCRAASQLPVAPNIPLVGLGKVFGFKVVLYNNVANTKVRIDTYLDPSGTGSQWKLAWSYIDDGKDPLIDSIRGNIRCQGERPELPIIFGGPAVSFRINADHVDFQRLTVQEIVPPRW